MEAKNKIMLIPLQKKKSHTSEIRFIKSTSIVKTKKKNLAHDLYVAQMVLSNQKENELGFFFLLLRKKFSQKLNFHIFTIFNCFI